MTRFEFIDEPYGVYFIGGIDGCWTGLKKFIGCVFGGRKQSDYMTLFEKRMVDRIYKGNGNLPLPRLAMEIANGLEKDPSCANKLIISAGSAQLGRYEPGYYDKVLGDLNGFLEEQRIKLLLVRGGDDDPSYYDGRVDYPNIKAIPDYSMVTVNTAYPKEGGVEMFCDDQRKILCIGGGMSERRTGYEMLYGLAKRSGKNLGGNVIFNGSGFYLSMKEIDEAEKEHVDTLVTFSDEINDLENYDERDACGILRHLLVWYRSGGHKKNVWCKPIERVTLASHPQCRRLYDYTSIYRLRGVKRSQIMTMDVDGSPAFLTSRLSDEIQRALLEYADIRADIGLDIAQGNI